MQSIKIQHEAFAIFRFYSCKYRDGGAGGGGEGGAASYFSRGKMFLFKYKVHAVSTRSTCHFTPYPGWVVNGNASLRMLKIPFPSL